MDIARVNLAYMKNQEEEKELYDTFKTACKNKGVHIPICVDIQGRSLRLGKLLSNEPIKLKKGDEMYITTNRHIGASHSVLYCDFAQLPYYVKPEDKILIDYGNISFTVKRVERETEVLLKRKGGGTIGQFNVLTYDIPQCRQSER